MSSKTMLMIVGVLLILMGVAAMFPSLGLATEPMWHAIAKVLIGIISVWISAADKNS